MKLWEVMRLLEENPTDVYEALLGGGDWKVRMTVKAGYGKYYYKFEVFDGERLVDQSLRGGAFNGNVTLELDWKLVRQPVTLVTLEEAIQAWADGKVVYVENKAGGRVYHHGGEDKKMCLLQSEITTGTWYVED